MHGIDLQAEQIGLVEQLEHVWVIISLSLFRDKLCPLNTCILGGIACSTGTVDMQNRLITAT